jgi:hypothetical protein
MGEVVRLAQFQNRDTAALLRALTIAAVNGDLIGIDAEVRMKGGRTARCISGPYTQPPRLAADGTSDTPQE